MGAAGITVSGVTDNEPAQPAAPGPENDPAVPAVPEPPNRKQRIIAGIVTLVVLVIVFAGILPKFGNYADAWDAIADMSMTQLLTLGAAVVLSIVVYVFPFTAAIPGLRFSPAFMIRQTSFTISNAIPAGGAIGLGVQYGMLAQAGVRGTAASAGIGITSVFNLLVTLVFPVLGVIALLWVGSPSSGEIIGAVGGLVAVGVMVALLTGVFRSDTTARRLGARLDRMTAWGAARLHRDAPAPLEAQLSAFRRSTVDVVADRWALITGTNFAQQFTQFVVLAVALRITETGETTQVPIAAAFAAFALARLAGFIPITPGGLGTVDAGLTGLLMAFGASNTDALAATLLWRAASWVPQVVLGVITGLIWRVRQGRSKQQGRAAAAPGAATS